MKGQKQSRLDLLEKKIDAITRVIDHLLKESSNTKTMSVGTYELLKYFPDFKEAAFALGLEEYRFFMTQKDPDFGMDNTYSATQDAGIEIPTVDVGMLEKMFKFAGEERQWGIDSKYYKVISEKMRRSIKNPNLWKPIQSAIIAYKSKQLAYR